jgi:hypothetical protein
MLKLIHTLLEAQYSQKLPEISVVNHTSNPFEFVVIFKGGKKRVVRLSIEVNKEEGQ